MSVQISRHLIINLVIVAAIVLLAVWVMNNTYWAEITVPKSLSGEAATNPFYAAEKFSNELGAKAEWKHVLSDSLDKNTVLVMSDWNWDVIQQRRHNIQKWVEAGGRLVLDASLITADESFEDWSGLKFDAVKRKSESSDEEEQNEDQKPAFNIGGDHDLCYLVDVAGSFEVTNSEIIPNRISLCNYDRSRMITSKKKIEWGLKDEHGWQVARVNIGKGSVTLFNAHPYEYRGLLLGDHALMFVATTQLKRDDQVFFIMDENGVPLLKLVWQYGSPVVILSALLIGVALWRNGTRFGPMVAVPETARRSLSEQIAGTGKFILQFNGDKVLHAATVRALTDAARIHIAHYERIDTASKMEALARETGISIEELQTAIHFQGSRRASDLRRAIAIMETARRHLLDRKANKVSNHFSEDSSGRSHAS
jgi:hypothetical protein